MARLLVGTAQGLHQVGNGERVEFAGHEVTALERDGATWWVILDGRSIWRSEDDGAWQRVAEVEGRRANCLLPTPRGLLVGTAEARLVRVADGGVEPVRPFDETEGRETWYTPWGGPPDARSMAGVGDLVYVNVHVGGIVRSADAGASWAPTLDIHADVHQVIVGPRPGLVLAAAARGLVASDDGGASWQIHTDGLHAPYARAVAVAGETILLTASSGPSGRQAAVYRAPLDRREPLERCRSGLPEWFASNVDTACLAASGSTAAFGTADGAVYRSPDEGRSWEQVAAGLPAVHCVAFG